MYDTCKYQQSELYCPMSSVQTLADHRPPQTFMYSSHCQVMYVHCMLLTHSPYCELLTQTFSTTSQWTLTQIGTWLSKLRPMSLTFLITVIDIGKYSKAVNIFLWNLNRCLLSVILCQHLKDVEENYPKLGIIFYFHNILVKAALQENHYRIVKKTTRNSWNMGFVLRMLEWPIKLNFKIWRFTDKRKLHRQ